MNISEHISYDEAIGSITAQQLGIDNTPPPDALRRMKDTAINVFEPLRKHFGVPIYITSFYRCEALNFAKNGSNTSQHLTGEAVDVDVDVYGKITNAEIFNYIKDNLLFDQLIWEYGDSKNPNWVHFSFRAGKNRKEVLKSVWVDGEAKYLPFT